MKDIVTTARHRVAALTAAIALVCVIQATSQDLDLLIRNGHVIDPRNKVDGRMDVAVAGGKIVRVSRDIPPGSARKVIDATGLYVTPGFIDIHTHVFTGSNQGFANGINSVAPDDFACRSGVTTVVDAGTSGWRNFELLRKQVIVPSKTRVLAFLNIAGWGMIGKPESEDTTDMEVARAVACMQAYRADIVGIKIGHYEGSSWTPFDHALQAAQRGGGPLLVECHLPAYSLEAQLARMRPGDIITHSFEKVTERQSVIDERGVVRPFVKEALQRGVLFDVGHGGAGFWFSEAIPALKQGLLPNSFGTDLHRFSVNAGMKDMLNVMSKYLAMGMDLRDVVLRATWLPARAIKRQDLGHLSDGAEADISIWGIRKGNFGFVDAGGFKLESDRKLEVEMTLRAGRVVWDLNGMSATKLEKK